MKKTLRYFTTLVVALGLTGIGLNPALAQPDDEDPALKQTVSADEEEVSGKATLEVGHVDLGPRMRDGN